MKLKTIKAYGFKSFADKINIDIKDGITGIVGPNGSGKSNIVDAVKWVMGEQSIKALRGSMNMSDVIFQGSKTRKPFTRASVSLVVDNSDHYLNTSFSEIEIKRTVYNSGENEYSINGSRVRLRDITDLFLDSGAGKEAFSIISQGQTLEILNSKPIDRRAIIEEAAGVLKYKKRKIESLKKLEKTNDNLSKIELVIQELLTTLLPLKEESQRAKRAKEVKEELASIETVMLVSDITKLNKQYEDIKEENENLKLDIEKLSNSTSLDDAKIEKLKSDLLKVETDINVKNQDLLKITEEISTLMSSRQVIVERKKYEVDDIKLESNIIALKESILSLKNDLNKLESDVETDKKDLRELIGKKDVLSKDLKEKTASRNNLVSEETLKNRLLQDIKNKINIAESNIESNSLVPYSVKSCLDNPRLKGLHGTVSDLITYDSEYADFISASLGSNQNVIVCDNEKAAKDAVTYLKDNKLGRATFFPINIIKPKFIKDDTYDIVKKDPGFIDIASNLVTNDSKYEDIIGNLLGNIIVARDIDSMNRIGKSINYSYRVVTLDGEILHTGGSITGGTLKNNKNSLTEKARLETLKDNKTTMEREIANLNKRESELDETIQTLINDLQELNIKITTKEEMIKNKEHQVTIISDDISSKELELKGTKNIKSSSLDAELEKTLNMYYDAVSKKDSLGDELERLKSQKSDLNDEINELDLKNKKVNSEYNKKVNMLNSNEVTIGKMDIRLDNLLLRLNEEYDITYEKARSTVDIDVDIEASRSKIERLKKELKSFGEVNYGSIEEYNRINERYEFLNSQKEDLNSSIDDLLSVINEMDDTMKKEFKTTFEKVNVEFEKVFAKLFKGGTGKLILTDPDDMLETGIDIVAEPPGKQLKNINLLSGGEKTLTAIALLFALLNVKPVPFCILDEVEAALDDANVESFGSYLKEYSDKTQFIVITHKKKTMEYANTLYGITMQESGVSKLVSVKLEGIN